MTERVLDQVMAMADQLGQATQAAEAEQVGRLTDDTVKLMKAAGLIRQLQPKAYQGFEVHPREFAETVMATAALIRRPAGSSVWWACIPISWPMRIRR